MFGSRIRAMSLGLMLVLGASGCSGGDEAPTLSQGELKRSALTQADLPDGYELEEQVDSTSPENCGDEGFSASFLATVKGLGFRACAGATYRKVVTEPNRQVNRPGSLLIQLRSADAASEALPKMRAALVDSVELTGGAEANTDVGAENAIPVSGLGDEAPAGMRLPVDLGFVAGDAELYVYFWRRGDVIAFVGTSDYLGDFDEGSTLELAKKIDGRIAG